MGNIPISSLLHNPLLIKEKIFPYFKEIHIFNIHRKRKIILSVIIHKFYTIKFFMFSTKCGKCGFYYICLYKKHFKVYFSVDKSLLKT